MTLHQETTSQKQMKVEIFDFPADSNLEVKLKGVKVMMTYLNGVWGSRSPSSEIINEVTKGNPLLQLLANIILETLGTQGRELQFTRFRRTSSTNDYIV